MQNISSKGATRRIHCTYLSSISHWFLFVHNFQPKRKINKREGISQYLMRYDLSISARWVGRVCGNGIISIKTEYRTASSILLLSKLRPFAIANVNRGSHHDWSPETRQSSWSAIQVHSELPLHSLSSGRQALCSSGLLKFGLSFAGALSWLACCLLGRSFAC